MDSKLNRNKLSAKIAAGILGLSAIGAGAFIAPAVAGAQTDAEPEIVTLDEAEINEDRVARAAERFQALVDNGTISQEQADQIAEQIANGEFRLRGQRGHRGGFDRAVVTDLLGLSQDELRTELRAGNTLAEVAEANGVDVATLASTLEDAINAAIDGREADGTLTAEEADAKRAEVSEKVEEKINRVKSEDGRRGHRGGPGADADAGDAPA